MSKEQIVLKLIPAQPASKARSHISYVEATTDEDKRNGFSRGIPHRSHLSLSSLFGTAISAIGLASS